MIKLKNLLILSACFFIWQSCVVSQNPNMSYFKNAACDVQNEKYTSINVPVFLAKPFVKNALKEDADEKDIYAILKKVSKIKILIIRDANTETLKNFSNYLVENGYQDWLSLNSEGNRINFKAIQEQKVIKKMMLSIKDEDKLILIDIKGSLKPEDISKFIKASEKADL